MNKYVVFTDGGCWPNPGGAGGWGALVILDKPQHLRDQKSDRWKLKGGERVSTNNRMELTAAMKAIEHVHNLEDGKRSEIVIMTDSKYLRNGITLWIKNWKLNGWMTKEWNGKPSTPVKNSEIWREIDRLAELHDVTWKWVPGHCGISGNEQADRLSSEGRAEIKGQVVDEVYAQVGA